MLVGFSSTQNSFLDPCSVYYALVENVVSVASSSLLRINSLLKIKTQDKQSGYE